MTAIELARKQDLCANLNMKFDEANELFGSETLKTMTMAQVNGGGDVVKWIIKYGGEILSFSSMVVGLTPGDPPPTPAPSDLEIRGIIWRDGRLYIENLPVDSITGFLGPHGYQLQIYGSTPTTTPAP